MPQRDSYHSVTSIRLPADLKAAAQRRAKAEHRSLSAQIVLLLERYVDSTPEPKPKKT